MSKLSGNAIQLTYQGLIYIGLKHEPSYMNGFVAAYTVKCESYPSDHEFNLLADAGGNLRTSFISANYGLYSAVINIEYYGEEKHP